MHYALQVNGLDNAYIKEFGCGCARCTRRARGANTSVSLIGRDDQGRVALHVLFDAGSGVTDSLLESTALLEEPRLDAVVLTHWHSDHTAELTRLCTTWARSRRRRGEAVAPVPVWCRSGSAAWLERQYPHLHTAGLEVRAFGAAESKGTLLEPIPVVAGLKLTPVSTSHYTADLHPERAGETHPCCAGYILEAPIFKVAFLWDLDATNLWLEKPEEHQRETIARLQGADHVFFDSNTWAYQTNPDGRPASHASFGLVQGFARALNPKHTWLVHLSGHEDEQGAGFGWEDAQWQHEARRVWREQHLPGDVRVPGIGETIELE